MAVGIVMAVISITVVLVLLTRMESKNKELARADLAGERVTSKPGGMLELVYEEVREAGWGTARLDAAGSRSRRAWLAGVVVPGLLFGVAACGGGEDAGRRVVTDADSTSEVLVGVGDGLEVRLPSNPTTGYSWRVEPPPTAVELQSSSFEEAEIVDDRVGVGGTEVFVFDVVAAGAEILRLEYIRPFDDPVVPERIVEYIVRVDNAPWPPTDVSPPATATATAPTTDD